MPKLRTHSHPIDVSAMTTPKPVLKKSDQSRSNITDYTTTVTILEAITEAIFILNAAGVVEYVNRSAQTYLQLDIDQIIGCNFSKFISSDDENTLQFLAGGLSGKTSPAPGPREIFSNADAVLQSPGQCVPVLITFSIIPGAQGEVQYTIVTAKEISYRKSLEKELRNRQALSVSFDRLKALGEMSVGLVHTLGQPVTAIDLRLEHITGMEDLNAIREQLIKVKVDVQRLAGIVGKIRSYAQTTSSRQVSTLELNPLILGVLKVMAYDLENRGVDVVTTLDPTIPPIEANEPELEQVFINLITNAIQAFGTARGDMSPSLLIETRSIENKWLWIGLEDNAGGISPAIAQAIFDPFFSTRDTDQHAGTGLSIAKSILSSLGGDLTYHPVPQGSRFEMRIPVASDNERDQLINLIELFSS